MNRKAKYAVGVVIVVLALLAPLTLQAQDDLSLNDIVKMVEALETRLAKIESLLADPWSPDVIYKDDGVCQSPLHTPYERTYQNSTLLNDRIHQETADAYRTEFGMSIDASDVDLISISFGVGSSNVYLEFDTDVGHRVVEKWAHCKYLGHSNWTTR